MKFIIDISVITSWFGLILGIGSIWAYIHPQMKRLSTLLTDWQGTEERPGVPRRPGVMERLSNIENRVDEISSITKEKR